METFIIIFTALLFIALTSGVWLDYSANVRHENKQLKKDYTLLEDKYFKLQREFSQLHKEKNKWVGETVRLKEKESK